mgnify:FL=1|tara:strand:+ start:1196 stop:1732 length:537 start_codon:yes stop_codon:yes gene_type:complete
MPKKKQEEIFENTEEEKTAETDTPKEEPKEEVMVNTEEVTEMPKKVKKPRKKRQLSDAQKEAMIERLRKGREKSLANRRAKKEQKEKENSEKKEKKMAIKNKMKTYDHQSANQKLLDKINSLETMIHSFKPKEKPIEIKEEPKRKTYPRPAKYSHKASPIGLSNIKNVNLSQVRFKPF